MVMWFYIEGLSGVKWGWEISLGCLIFVQRHWETKIQTDKKNNNNCNSRCSALSFTVLPENTLVIRFDEHVVGLNAKRPHFLSLTRFFFFSCFCILFSTEASVMLKKKKQHLARKYTKVQKIYGSRLYPYREKMQCSAFVHICLSYLDFGLTVKSVSSVSSYQTKQGKNK